MSVNFIFTLVIRAVTRWYKVDGTVGVSYLPKSPLSALPATGVLCGFGLGFMTGHAIGRSLVAVPVAWIDALAPNARAVLRALRARNRSGVGRPDISGENATGAILRLVSCCPWSKDYMQLG